MAKEKLEKTNAIRALDKAKLTYTVHTYENDGTAVDGVTVAQKTRVCRWKRSTRPW